MERFSSIYPFTTENISGYLKDLNLKDKKIITVTGSSDHIINAILQGSMDITTFDINPLTKKYMDLKLAAIKCLSLDEFLQVFLYDTTKSFDYKIISSLDIPKDSKEFWMQQLSLVNNNGENLRESKLFNRKYFNPESKFWQNLYLSKESYNEVKEKLNSSQIKFINQSLQDLNITEHYDYMFLSNISDYLNLMFDGDCLINYKNLIENLLRKIDNIYFAYLYDIGNSNPRSEIDDLKKVRSLFKNIDIKIFESALENEGNKKDGVLILRRN